MRKNHILIVDSSNLILTVFFATKNEYAKKYRSTLVQQDWCRNHNFLDLFQTKFYDLICKIQKRYRVPFSLIYLVRDSPKEKNWRKVDFDTYKDNRKLNVLKHKQSVFHVGSLFKYVYNEIFETISKRCGFKILKVDRAEADDTIGVLCYLLPTNINITIITSDTDFLQLLVQPNCRVFDLQGKSLDQKLNGKTPKEYLLSKIILGDKTDHIPSCFSKISEAKYYLEHLDELDQLL